MKKGLIILALFLLFVGLVIYSPYGKSAIYVLDTPRDGGVSGGSGSTTSGQEYSRMDIFGDTGSISVLNMSGAPGEYYEVHLD